MRFLPILLAATLSLGTPDTHPPSNHPALVRPHIVEDNYSQSDTFRIVKNGNVYEKFTVSGKERFKQTVQSTKEILYLPICIDVEMVDDGFLLPSKIEGIVMDIPFNYYSSLESSARYLQTLLYNGWEIEYYNATSLCIQVGLIRDGVICRLLIYEDYLKVYCKLLSHA